MHPNNRLTINAIEAYPIDDFSPDVSSVGEGRLCANISLTLEHHYYRNLGTAICSLRGPASRLWIWISRAEGRGRNRGRGPLCSPERYGPLNLFSVEQVQAAFVERECRLLDM